MQFEQSAFSQLVNVGIAKVIGRSMVVEGFVVQVLHIEQSRCEISAEKVSQGFDMEVFIERPRGWMPMRFKSRGSVAIDWKWADADDFLRVQLLSMEVQLAEDAQVDVAGLKFGLPKVVKNKLLGNVAERIPTVEAQINDFINASIRSSLQQPFDLPVLDGIPMKDPKGKINKLDVEPSLEENMLVLDVDAKVWTGLSQQIKASTPSLSSVLNKSVSHDKSFLRLGATYDLLNRLTEEREISLPKNGQLTIKNPVFDCVDSGCLTFTMDVVGTLVGKLSGKIIMKESRELQVELKEFNMDLSNKILDFGVSLFEQKIKEKLEDEINQQLHKMQLDAVKFMNQELSRYNSNFSLPAPVNLENIKGEMTFETTGWVFLIKTNALRNIVIHDVSPFLAATVKA